MPRALLHSKKTFQESSLISFYSRIKIIINQFVYKLLKSFYEGSKTKGTQPAITCSKLAMETIKQGVKYVQS